MVKKKIRVCVNYRTEKTSGGHGCECYESWFIHGGRTRENPQGGLGDGVRGRVDYVGRNGYRVKSDISTGS